MKNNIFVVSCQALKNEPLYGEGIMNKMAHAAIMGGADWIRTSQIHNIKSMLSDQKINVPIIGIIKKEYLNSEVIITPSIIELKKLIDTGVDIIAMDATARKRPNESLEEMIKFFFDNKAEGQKIMADCSSVEDMIKAEKLGFDYVGTTLAGYTKETKDNFTPYDNFKIIRDAKKYVKVPVIAEGGVDTPILAKKAFEAGANIVVVGSQITRPRLITKRFIDEIKK